MSQILALKSRLQAIQMSKDVRKKGRSCSVFLPALQGVGGQQERFKNDHSDAKTAVLLPVTRLLCIDYHRFIMIHM